MAQKATATMPCNPAVGGIGKSHMVRELDALGGEIARNADFTGIQFRTLNMKKGPAVRAHRIQCDKHAYERRMRAVVAGVQGLRIIEGEAIDLCIESGRLAGVTMSDGSHVRAQAVIIAAGTFFRGRMYVGKECTAGGREGIPPSDRLAAALEEVGFRMARLKTGTPPRLIADSVDVAAMEVQLGLDPPPFLSWEGREKWRMFHVEHSGTDQRLFHVEQSEDPLCPWLPGSGQIPCYLTHTTQETHQLIRDNLGSSALYGGSISGTGVRYCPSVEDKIVKFPEKKAHHVFIEPEGRHARTLYPNGLSNSLPADVQEQLIHSVPGLEQARISSMGYAIEYDFSDPTQLCRTLETKLVENLYIAGQLNGTTGYEEAAGQGFIAGVNAVRKLRKQTPFELRRDQAYLGVLVDDLVTKGTDEPYRMFTSRAEYRLLLGQDSAHARLLSTSSDLGLTTQAQLNSVTDDLRSVESEISRLADTRHEGDSLASRLRRSDVAYRDLPGSRTDLSQDVIAQIENTIKYEGYVSREMDRIAKAQAFETCRIPDWIDYDSVHALSYEAREKLRKIAPTDLGQASRISGVTPADIAILEVTIRRGSTSRATGTSDCYHDN
jgi:tRNA uridine 5-carboxymethylaminomethyl modification enzyme